MPTCHLEISGSGISYTNCGYFSRTLYNKIHAETLLAMSQNGLGIVVDPSSEDILFVITKEQIETLKKNDDFRNKAPVKKLLAYVKGNPLSKGENFYAFLCSKK